MEKYPLNPWAFEAVFICLIMASTLEDGTASPRVREFAMYAPGLAFLLQLVWSWQAVRFISIIFPPAAKIRRRFELLLKLAAAGMGIIVVGSTFTEQLAAASSKELSSAIIMIFGMVVVAVVLAVFWNAAAALCMAEDGAETPPSRIVGTGFLFLYLVIGAPFLYRRLKALDCPGTSAGFRT
jgi:hypothetical protein